MRRVSRIALYFYAIRGKRTAQRKKTSWAKPELNGHSYGDNRVFGRGKQAYRRRMDLPLGNPNECSDSESVGETDPMKWS